MPFCMKCGSEFQEGMKFCPSCGANIELVYAQTAQPQPVEEKAFYKGEGELVIKRTQHHGAGRKIASWLALGPIGYVAFGRDKTRKSKAKGTLVVTNKALYCAGNDYPFDRILSIGKTGRIRKSIMLTFEKEVGAGGRDAGIGGNYTIEAELKTKDIDGLFRGLEQAKMAGIRF